MRRIAAIVLVVGTFATLGPASQAFATTITNGTVTLGVNPQGNLNSSEPARIFGVTYNATGNDGTRAGCLCEGWGAGAGGPTPFRGVANQSAGNEGYRQVSFTSTATGAVSVVDILRDGVPALRLAQDFHPSPTTPNLYEITTTLENITDGPLKDVRYERIMDWDVEPTVFSEFVTINRGTTPPANLIYSDDNGFSDNDPFTNDGPSDPSTVNADYEDKGPDDHGARFTFGFGDLASGESKQFFLYYGAAGNEADADAAVSAAALELFSYGQPNTADGPALGTPNTFIWGFRAVGGKPVIPPALTLSPKTATNTVGDSHTLTATLRDSEGNPVPGAEIIFGASGANSATGSGTTDAGGQSSFSYAGAVSGQDTITACLDGNSNGACDSGEVSDTATKKWEARPNPLVPQPQQQILGTVQAGPPPPIQGSTVNVGEVSGKVRYKRRGSKTYTELEGIDQIPVGSTVDASQGRVRLTSAADKTGKTQAADFYRGAFVIKQSKGSPVTELKLDGGRFSSCPKAGKASASARKRVRRLFGSGKGAFRTRGRHAAATVRGTTWVTEDFCDGTRVRVTSGKVTVRDLVKKKNFSVRKGKSYFARARR